MRMKLFSVFGFVLASCMVVIPISGRECEQPVGPLEPHSNTVQGNSANMPANALTASPVQFHSSTPQPFLETESCVQLPGPPGANPPNPVVIDPTNDSRIYVGSGGYLFKSEDGGNKWKAIQIDDFTQWWEPTRPHQISILPSQ
jgi:hypothetical protein